MKLSLIKISTFITPFVIVLFLTEYYYNTKDIFNKAENCTIASFIVILTFLILALLIKTKVFNFTIGKVNYIYGKTTQSFLIFTCIGFICSFWFAFALHNFFKEDWINNKCKFQKNDKALNILVTPLEVLSTKVDSKYENFLVKYIEGLPDSLNIKVCKIDSIPKDLFTNPNDLDLLMKQKNIDVIISGSYWMNQFDKTISFDIIIYPSQEVIKNNVIKVGSVPNKYVFEEPSIQFKTRFSEYPTKKNEFIPFGEFESAFINGELDQIKELKAFPYVFKAFKLCKQNKYNEAYKLFQEAKQTMNLYYIEAFMLSILMKLNKINEAKEFFEKSENKNSDMMVFLGVILYSDDYDALVKNKVLFQGAQDRGLKQFIDIIYAQIAYWDGRITLDSLLRTTSIKDNKFKNLANAMILLKMGEKHFEFFLDSLLFDSNYHYPYYYIKGLHAYETNDVDKLITNFEKSLSSYQGVDVFENDSIEVKLPLPFCYFSLSLAHSNKYKELKLEEDSLLAIKYTNILINLDNKNAAYYYFQYLIFDELHIDSIGLIDLAIKIDPANYLYWMAKGYSFYEKSKYKEAIQLYNQAILLATESDKLYPTFFKANALFYNHEYFEANKNYNESINILNNYYTDTDFMKAQIYAFQASVSFGLNDFTMGYDYANKCIQIDSLNVMGNNFAAYYHIMNEDFATAKKFKDRIEVNFDSVYLYMPSFEYYYDIYYNENERILNNIERYGLSYYEKIKTEIVLNIEIGQINKALQILSDNFTIINDHHDLELFFDLVILSSIINLVSGKVVIDDDFGVNELVRTSTTNHPFVVSSLFELSKGNYSEIEKMIHLFNEPKATHNCYYDSYIYILLALTQKQSNSVKSYFNKALINADNLMEKAKNYKGTLQAKERNLNRLYTYIIVAFYLDFFDKKNSLSVLRKILKDYPKNSFINELISDYYKGKQKK